MARRPSGSSRTVTRLRAKVLPAQSLFESALSRTYANSAVSALSLEQALACKTGFPLLARSLWARFRQPRRQGFLGQTIEIPHSSRLSDPLALGERDVEKLAWM